MARPTEQEKKTKKTKEKLKAKVKFGNVEEEVDITVETTPNAQGGYDTNVQLPFCPISAVHNQ